MYLPIFETTTFILSFEKKSSATGREKKIHGLPPEKITF